MDAVTRICPQESPRPLGQRLHGQSRSQAQHQQQGCAHTQRRMGARGHIVLQGRPLANSTAGDKNRHEQLCHVRRCQSAGEQKQPLHRREPTCGGPRVLQHMDVLHDALMEQGLAHIAGKTRYACNGGRPHEEQDLQNRLVPPPAPDVIEIQRVSSQIHHTCRHKQHQLDEGVVQHVQHRAPGRQGVLAVQEALHGCAHQNKADLGHGGAGQRPLQIDGEQRQHSSQHHGHHAQGQYHCIPGKLCPEQIPAENEHTENTALGQDAGQQGRRRCRRHGMGFWQPDVQGEHPGLGAKSHQCASTGHVQGPALLRRQRGYRLRHSRKLQRPQQLLEEQQARQQRHAADHSHSQIRLSGLPGLLRLVLHHPYIGGEGHHLKEHEQREQVRCQKHPHQSPQRQQPEKVETITALGGGKVAGAVEAGGRPQEGAHQRQQAPQTPGLKPQCSGQLHCGNDLDQPIPVSPVPPPQREHPGREQHGEQDQKQQQNVSHRLPPLPVPRNRVP